MKTKALILALLLTGCAATTNPERESGARWTNAGAGALLGCVLTGPFCILPIVPIIGAIVGGMVTVDGHEKKEQVKVEP
jgi:uncharacterized protein YqgC (DUF456 family)